MGGSRTALWTFIATVLVATPAFAPCVNAQFVIKSPVVEEGGIEGHGALVARPKWEQGRKYSFWQLLKTD